MELDEYRTIFPITKKYVFLNHAAMSPISLRVADAVQAFYEECTNQASKEYPAWMKKIALIRHMAADLINAEFDEIAFICNTSHGISSIAGGFKWKSGDVVLVPVPDFPSNIYPWMDLEKNGVEVNFIKRYNGKLGVKEVSRALKPGTRMLTISSVDFATGFAADLMELGAFCQEKGILFCVDAIQNLGMTPIDVKACNIHFLASGSHKWLLGPLGTGILYISKEANDLVDPTCVGWKSVVDEENFNVHFILKPDALRFEYGTMNLAGIFALGASLKMLSEIGVRRINKKVLDLNAFFIQKLQNRKLEVTSSLFREKERSGILAFKPAGDPARCYKFLSDRKIMISLRQSRIRLSPHFYNNEADVTAFFDVLDDFLKLV